MIPTEKPGTPEELVHYGVKGMKWGVRRDLRRERKAQKFVQKSADIRKQIGAQDVATRSGRKKIAKLEKRQAQADRDAEAKRQGKLSRRQKQVVVGAAVVGTLAAAGVLAVTLNSGQARQVMVAGQEKIAGKKFDFKKDPSLSDPNLDPSSIARQVASKINPGYQKNQLGSAQNCRRATFAYEMRRRGYDVQATRTPTGSGQNAIGLYNALTPGAKNLSKRTLQTDNDGMRAVQDFARNISSRTKIDGAGSKSIFDILSRQPERSRGELGVMWVDGGGHSMAYEVINGAAHIFDTQTGRRFSSPADFAKDMPLVARAGFTRLDNADLDENFLRRWVKNA